MYSVTCSFYGPVTDPCLTSLLQRSRFLLKIRIPEPLCCYYRMRLLRRACTPAVRGTTTSLDKSVPEDVMYATLTRKSP